MAECQECGAAVIVPRPIQIDDRTWLLVCNKCARKINRKIFVGTNS
ncbi:MAG: hypothetical protein ACFFDT_30040 [Candidatus Hodarchaeota archaeon]